LALGLNAHQGKIVYKAVSDVFGEYETATLSEIL
jgi:alanine dehydrogenase